MTDTTHPITGTAHRTAAALLATLLAGSPAVAQVPVDDDGNPLSDEVTVVDGDDPVIASTAAVRDAAELERLVGPVALYPDDLLAIVLPASTYPLQVVQAARYLEAVEDNPSLEPDEDWDDSVVALLNYPEVLNLMNDDIDWTWALGAAVVDQQSAVIAAIESFRDRAYAAGNLQTDERQTVTVADDGAIEIEPVEEDIIYVPYYEPERVVYASPAPVYHYYPRAYPVYYYPYPRYHHFHSGLFWGVTTAFSIGWVTDHLHVYHHSYRGHPFFGRHYGYYGSYWRRPSINIYNTWYANVRSPYYRYRHARGDYWRPRNRHADRPRTRVVDSGYNRDRGDRRNREQRRDRRTDNAITFRDRRTDGLRFNAGRQAKSPGIRGDNASTRANREQRLSSNRVRSGNDRNRSAAVNRSRDSAINDRVRSDNVRNQVRSDTGRRAQSDPADRRTTLRSDNRQRTTSAPTLRRSTPSVTRRPANTQRVQRSQPQRTSAAPARRAPSVNRPQTRSQPASRPARQGYTAPRPASRSQAPRARQSSGNARRDSVNRQSRERGSQRGSSRNRN